MNIVVVFFIVVWYFGGVFVRYMNIKFKVSDRFVFFVAM